MWVVLEPDEGRFITLSTYKQALEQVQDKEIGMWVFEMDYDPDGPLQEGYAEWCEYEEEEDE